MNETLMSITLIASMGFMWILDSIEVNKLGKENRRLKEQKESDICNELKKIRIELEELNKRERAIHNGKDYFEIDPNTLAEAARKAVSNANFF